MEKILILASDEFIRSFTESERPWLEIEAKTWENIVKADSF